MSHANLHGACLSDATILNLEMPRSDLSDAVFAAADLSGADFSGCNVARADFSGANLSDCKFDGAAGLDLVITSDDTINSDVLKRSC